MCCVRACVCSPDPQPPNRDGKTPPRPSEGGDGSGIVLPSTGQGETPRPHGQEGAPEPPKLGGVGDPITISDESGDGPRLTCARATDKGVETPQVKGRTPWPIGLHSIEEKKKKDEEERRKEEEGKKRKEEAEQSHLQGQL